MAECMTRGGASSDCAGYVLLYCKNKSVSKARLSTEDERGNEVSVSDLVCLLKRFWPIVLAVPLAVCVLAICVYTLGNVGTVTYSATAKILANSQLPTVYGIVLEEIDAYEKDGEGDRVSFAADSAPSMSMVEIVATGEDADKCIACVNTLAKKAVDSASAFLANTEKAEGVIPFEAHAVESVSATAISGKNVGFYVVVALLTGLILAVGVVFAIGLMRGYVISGENVAAMTSHPVWSVSAGDKRSERRLASIQFLVKGAVPARLCVIPISSSEVAGEIANAIEAFVSSWGTGDVVDDGGASAKSDSWLVECECPLALGVDAVYEAKKCDAVILAVRQFADRLSDVKLALDELEMAGIQNVGIVVDMKEGIRG